MGGLLILFVLAIYVWIGYAIVRRITSALGKTLAIAALVSLPSADAIYGRLKLKEMCEADGGLRVNRAVEKVEGFYEILGPDEMWIKKYKFTFVEGGGASSKRVTRLSMEPNGAILSEKDVEKKSIYQLNISTGDPSDLYSRTQFAVETMDGKETLARIVDFNYAGGWVERAAARLYAHRGSAGTCGLKPYIRGLQEDLVVTTFKRQ